MEIEKQHRNCGDAHPCDVSVCDCFAPNECASGEDDHNIANVDEGINNGGACLKDGGAKGQKEEISVEKVDDANGKSTPNGGGMKWDLSGEKNN